MEKQIFDTLVKIRKQDRSIYDNNQRFFADTEEQAAEGSPVQGKGTEKAKRPMYLKDVIAQQVQLTDMHMSVTSLPSISGMMRCCNIPGLAAYTRLHE